MAEKVLILGLSKSGIAAAKFAASKGYDVYITESKGVNEVRRLDNPATPPGIKGVNPQIEELKSLGIKIACIVKSLSPVHPLLSQVLEFRRNPKFSDA